MSSTMTPSDVSGTRESLANLLEEAGTLLENSLPHLTVSKSGLSTKISQSTKATFSRFKSKSTRHEKDQAAQAEEDLEDAKAVKLWNLFDKEPEAHIRYLLAARKKIVEAWKMTVELPPSNKDVDSETARYDLRQHVLNVLDKSLPWVNSRKLPNWIKTLGNEFKSSQSEKTLDEESNMFLRIVISILAYKETLCEPEQILNMIAGMPLSLREERWSQAMQFAQLTSAGKAS